MRDQFLARNCDAMVRHLIPGQTCHTISKPAVVFCSRAAHVNRARLRPCPRRRPLACARSRTTCASRTPRTTTWAPSNAIEPRWATHRHLEFGSLRAVGREEWRPRFFLHFGECLACAEPYPFPRRRARAARSTNMPSKLELITQFLSQTLTAASELDAVAARGASARFQEMRQICETGNGICAEDVRSCF